MLAEDCSTYLNYVSDVVSNPLFDSSKIEEERKRVLREISNEMSDSTRPTRIAYSEAFFGKNSSRLYYTLGKKSVIESATAQDLKKFHKRGYVPNNMDLILVGALPENIDELIEETFASMKPGLLIRLYLKEIRNLTVQRYYIQKHLNYIIQNILRKAMQV